jgi:hypothetical protein
VSGHGRSLDTGFDLLRIALYELEGAAPTELAHKISNVLNIARELLSFFRREGLPLLVRLAYVSK